jgi:hypothetical protein
MEVSMGGNRDDREAYGPEHANFTIDVKGILEALHRWGLTAEITWSGRGPIEVKLGHALTGNVASTGAEDEVLTVAEAALWLRNKACQHFPESRFARKYRNQVERPGSIHSPGTRWARSCGCTCPAEQRRPGDSTYRVDPNCPAHGFR